MKAMIYQTLFLFLFGILGCSQDEHVEDQDPECIELTIDDSLYTYLATVDTLPLGAYFEIVMDINGPMVELVDDCLKVKVLGGGPNRRGIVYKLIWNGKFTNDTADVYFHFYNPEYVWGTLTVDVLWRNEYRSFSVLDIIESKPGTAAFIRTHLNDAVYDGRYIKVIEI